MSDEQIEEITPEQIDVALQGQEESVAETPLSVMNKKALIEYATSQDIKINKRDTRDKILNDIVDVEFAEDAEPEFVKADNVIAIHADGYKCFMTREDAEEGQLAGHVIAIHEIK